ncbi:helix-turn-helix domain-containing protein [Streptomonospora sp. PA3]|uniref:helix-turn-helix domain-containing protein n=1 Tax=Streptomonospora sp. PA3 TaxID=2607326 RepID=UPI0012DD824F|nr:helix-turn-helix transcriptional regulator [Streptomonospora sp. PA3]MUL39649.1 helix-turn-helix domain-containing protein [Streptomonospora sp. PA3]
MAGSPTVRRRRLSYELRALREAAGKTATEVTDALGWSRGKLTHIEQNQWKRPSVRDIEDLLDAYGVDDDERRQALITLAKQARQRGWWVSYSDVWGGGTFIGLEAEARSMRTFEPLAIPGLLQTEAYARAIIRAGGITDEDDLSRRVQARMLRKQVLESQDAPLYWAIIDEAALLKVTPELAGQLQYLLDVQRPTLGVQVLPSSIGPHAAMTSGFVMMDFPEPDPSAVYVDTGSDQLFLEKPDHLERYEILWRHIQASALSVDESRRLIADRLASVK